jgi:hypothetical protein
LVASATLSGGLQFYIEGFTFPRPNLAKQRNIINNYLSQVSMTIDNFQ